LRVGGLGAVLIFVLGHISGLVLEDAYQGVKKRLFPTEPVAINLQFDPAAWEAGNPFGGESYEWVFPLPRSLLHPPPQGACFQRYAWAQGAAGADGVDARTTPFRLTIQGNSGDSVLLQKITPIIHKRGPRMEGTHVACPVGGAAANLRRFAVDLDRGTGTFEDGEGNPLATTMLKFDRQESEPIQVIARAERGRYDWALRLDFIVDGEVERAFIPEEGRLFSTTGVGQAQTIHWDGRRWRQGTGPPVGAEGPTSGRG
jgi:hypothetical protein